jgi:hypothetical protein
MHDQPITIGKIANLLHSIRAITGDPTAEPAARAEVLARKAALLAPIAHQRAQEWNCEHAEQAHQIAADAKAVAEQARQTATA